MRTRSPRGAALQQETPRFRGAHAGVLTSPSWDPVRPNRTHRAIQRALVSNRRLHVSESWHRAPLLAEEELGAHEGRGSRRAPLPEGAAKRMRQLTLQSSRAKTSDIGWAVTALLGESRGTSAGPRDSARERVRRRPYPGRSRACSASEVVCSSARSMQAVTSAETGMTGFVRTTASEVSGHALPVFSFEERGSRSLARAEAIHAARTAMHRSRPSEERRCLPLCGRANVPRGGRKRRRHVLPPCTGKVVGSLG